MMMSRTAIIVLTVLGVALVLAALLGWFVWEYWTATGAESS